MFFKKKKIIHSKFKVNDLVFFHYNNDLKLGNIVKIYENDNIILYDIQIGGECPSIIKGILENKITKK